MNTQKTQFPDGNYFSPDGGYLTAKGNKLYWEDGDITENPSIIRIIAATGPDFSLMTDEERAQKQAEVKDFRDKEKARRAALENAGAPYRERQSALLASAKAKLTPEEFTACLEEGRNYE
jgi:hypothetical protein